MKKSILILTCLSICLQYSIVASAQITEEAISNPRMLQDEAVWDSFEKEVMILSAKDRIQCTLALCNSIAQDPRMLIEFGTKKVFAEGSEHIVYKIYSRLLEFNDELGTKIALHLLRSAMQNKDLFNALEFRENGDLGMFLFNSLSKQEQWKIFLNAPADFKIIMAPSLWMKLNLASNFTEFQRTYLGSENVKEKQHNLFIALQTFLQVPDLRFDLLSFKRIEYIIRLLSHEQQQEFDSMLLDIIVTSEDGFYGILEQDEKGKTYRKYVNNLIWQCMIVKKDWVRCFLNKIKNPRELYVAMRDITIPYLGYPTDITLLLSEEERCKFARKLYRQFNIFNTYEKSRIFLLCFGYSFDRKAHLLFMHFLKTLRGIDTFTILQKIEWDGEESSAIDNIFKFTKEHLYTDTMGDWAKSPEGKKYIEALLYWETVISKIVIKMIIDPSFVLSDKLRLFLIGQFEKIPVKMRTVNVKIAYQNLNFLAERGLSERTIEEVSQIIGIAYTEGITKEQLKPMCIQYLENVNLSKGELLALPMDQFTDLFFPLLKINAEGTLEIQDTVSQKIKDFYKTYMDDKLVVY